MQGDSAKARAASNGYFTLWKNGDPDIPIFVAAKAEYAKLQYHLRRVSIHSCHPVAALKTRALSGRGPPGFRHARICG